jgi:hypothetical protein
VTSCAILTSPEADEALRQEPQLLLPYDAVCTPEFFGVNAALELQYRGRLDASRTTLVPDARREPFEAMCRIAETGKGPEQQASIGCSIKWRCSQRICSQHSVRNTT